MANGMRRESNAGLLTISKAGLKSKRFSNVMRSFCDIEERSIYMNVIGYFFVDKKYCLNSLMKVSMTSLCYYKFKISTQCFTSWAFEDCCSVVFTLFSNILSFWLPLNFDKLPSIFFLNITLFSGNISEVKEWLQPHNTHIDQLGQETTIERFTSMVHFLPPLKVFFVNLRLVLQR